MASTDAFDYDYDGMRIVYGRGAVSDLDDLLADRGLDRALVVCGSHVGSNRDLMDPIEAGLGDRLVGVFDGTTPDKRAEDVYAAIDAMHEADADVLVGVGGGSSLDTAREASAFDADGRSLADFREEFRETGAIDPPRGGGSREVVVIPTTFAGAEVSVGGSIEIFSVEDSPTDQPVRISGYCPPIAIIEDPALFSTTPRSALLGSAINGFNKGLDTVYSRNHAAITDATAIRGLQAYRDGLPRLDEPEGMDRAVLGSVLVQFEPTYNVLHAVGHGFARRYEIQQGMAHAAIAPGVLEYVLDAAVERRAVLAEGLGVAAEGRSSDAVAAACVDTVRELRDGLGLPNRLRDLEGIDRDELRAVAAYAMDDAFMADAPEALDPTVDELAAVLDGIW